MFLPYLEEITYLDKPNKHNLNFFRKTYLMDFFELGLVFDENEDLIGIKNEDTTSGYLPLHFNSILELSEFLYAFNKAPVAKKVLDECAADDQMIKQMSEELGIPEEDIRDAWL
ncbi:hypothetical protein DFW61_08835 [Campylobacter coli]|nr:hypothetical protein [Campylobacter coli]